MHNSDVEQLTAEEALLKNLNSQQIELVIMWLKETSQDCSEGLESRMLLALSERLVTLSDSAVYEPSMTHMIEAIHQMAKSLERLDEDRTASKLRMVGNCISHRLGRRLNV